MASNALFFYTLVKQLETWTGVNVKCARRDGAKEYFSNELEA